ncbi:Hsp20/alpha crystallin family protein [Actinoplanes sp. NBRC 101535]|uniref:Hsp20/alpha crystallin family protein n=1 Tax=Actinoplanes sp. NBRC 101535 TaxID=3032196 RepID=UPI0024A1D154|nr:Hsp20/alpha crystallin family protein [Actinoplanes sp. NBRC 101535]GLY08712.1 hypothetical protein Acsp01_90910 [Actinoplanes sp. NBRC 101535]
MNTLNGVLALKAERRERTDATSCSEFRYGALHRSVRLPINADEAAITATHDMGILEVTVPLTVAETADLQIGITTK